MKLPLVLLALLLLTLCPMAQDSTDNDDEEDDEDTLEINADSLASVRTAYDLTGLSQHIGANGLTIFGSFIKQFDGRNTTLPGVHSFGAGFSGDVLTGLSFIHLIPTFHYWSYSEEWYIGYQMGKTYRDVGMAFHTALITPRLTARKARLFLGAGPSMHLAIISQSYEGEQISSSPYFKNGFSLLTGLELPLTGTFSFIATAAYKQTYDWSRLDRQYLMISLGVAM
jgi:hypothetical protein